MLNKYYIFLYLLFLRIPFPWRPFCSQEPFKGLQLTFLLQTDTDPSLSAASRSSFFESFFEIHLGLNLNPCLPKKRKKKASEVVRWENLDFAFGGTKEASRSGATPFEHLAPFTHFVLGFAGAGCFFFRSPSSSSAASPCGW